VWQLLGRAWASGAEASVLLEWDAEIPSFDVVHQELLRAHDFIQPAKPSSLQRVA
jgi:uncharacterized protein (UPF0276 family)